MSATATLSSWACHHVTFASFAPTLLLSREQLQEEKQLETSLRHGEELHESVQHENDGLAKGPRRSLSFGEVSQEDSDAEKANVPVVSHDADVTGKPQAEGQRNVAAAEATTREEKGADALATVAPRRETPKTRPSSASSAQTRRSDAAALPAIDRRSKHRRDKKQQPQSSKPRPFKHSSDAQREGAEALQAREAPRQRQQAWGAPGAASPRASASRPSRRSAPVSFNIDEITLDPADEGGFVRPSAPTRPPRPRSGRPGSARPGRTHVFDSNLQPWILSPYHPLYVKPQAWGTYSKLVNHVEKDERNRKLLRGWEKAVGPSLPHEPSKPSLILRTSSRPLSALQKTDQSARKLLHATRAAWSPRAEGAAGGGTAPSPIPRIDESPRHTRLMRPHSARVPSSPSMFRERQEQQSFPSPPAPVPHGGSGQQRFQGLMRPRSAYTSRGTAGASSDGAAALQHPSAAQVLRPPGTTTASQALSTLDQELASVLYDAVTPQLVEEAEKTLAKETDADPGSRFHLRTADRARLHRERRLKRLRRALELTEQL